MTMNDSKSNCRKFGIAPHNARTLQNIEQQECLWFVGYVNAHARLGKSLEEFLEDIYRLRHPLEKGHNTLSGLSVDEVKTLVIQCIKIAYPEDKAEWQSLANKVLGNICLLSESKPVHSSAINLTQNEVAEKSKENPIKPKDVPIISTAATQTVSAQGDILAPIVQANGGTVIITTPHRNVRVLLESTEILLIYLSLKAKQKDLRHDHAVALNKLFSDWSKHSQHTDDAISDEELFVQILKISKDILGIDSVLQVKDSTTRSQMPRINPADNMIFIPEGVDPITGLSVPPFYVSKYPVTEAEYLEFAELVPTRRPEHWPFSGPSSPDAPVVNVSGYLAISYCWWLQTATGFAFRLITEPEWNRCANGNTRRIYPWGNKFDSSKCWTSERGVSQPSSVRSHPTGASPYGVEDLAGNTWELTGTLASDMLHGSEYDSPRARALRPCPIIQAMLNDNWWMSDKRVPVGVGGVSEAVRLVMKGGSFAGNRDWCKNDVSIWTSLGNRGGYGSFRIACPAILTEAGTWIPSPSPLIQGPSPFKLGALNKPGEWFIDPLNDEIKFEAYVYRSRGCTELTSSGVLPIDHSFTTEVIQSLNKMYDLDNVSIKASESKR